MRAFMTYSDYPSGIPLVADDIVEFHAARLLLLHKICGKKGKIEGLTKMAKLDFFVRYPDFFNKALNDNVNVQNISINRVESTMIRHHYGPWDKRYYHILSYLEAKELISVTKENKTYVFQLTEQGASEAKALMKLDSFNELINHMKVVKKAFGNRSGNILKNIIYKTFYEEVALRELGEVIQ